MTQRATQILFLMSCIVLLNGCSQSNNPALPGLPVEVFEAEQEYRGSLRTVGKLSEAYVFNTSALRSANNKLTTICVAANRCEQPDG